MARKDREFMDSARRNQAIYQQYYNRLKELAISRFAWLNLPDTVDARFMEMKLFYQGQVVFFRDDVIGDLALPVTAVGKLDVYGIPFNRRAYATNGYQKQLDETNSVIIYNNLIHTNSVLDIQVFAERLANLDRSIDVNAAAQKTPVLIQCDETQRLTMLNLYQKYEGNAPVIFGSRGLDTKGLTVLKTDAPYVADKLYDLKTQIWNEALTYLGISNVAIEKKERLISDEVERAHGGTIASRFSALTARQQACEEINKMFGLNIECVYREDIVPETSDDEEDEEVSEADE